MQTRPSNRLFRALVVDCRFVSNPHTAGQPVGTAMDEAFTSLRAESRFEPDKIKGSRFIASLCPVQDEQAVSEFRARVAAEFSDARHHCYAWRLGQSGEQFRCSDDGEPSGSAGRPILMQLEGHELTNVCCVVTRYFGGTKLGVGGLMRAYGGAAGKACDRAELVQVIITSQLQIEHPYALSGPVQGLLSAYSLEPLKATYGETVKFTLHVPIVHCDAFLTELRDRTADRARVIRKL